METKMSYKSKSSSIQFIVENVAKKNSSGIKKNSLRKKTVWKKRKLPHAQNDNIELLFVYFVCVPEHDSYTKTVEKI